MFWLLTYRRTAALPPMWNVRGMSMQGTTVAVFVPTVVGAAAWAGTRDRRHGMADLLAGTARSRWARQVAVWAATSGWALAAYAACVGVLYAVTARQGAGAGPLWWPVAVGAASIPALAALGTAAGNLLPSRFTPPLAAVGSFVALELSLELIHGGRSPWQVSPLIAGPWELGSGSEGVATFHPYLSDLPIAQLIFLAGLTAVLLGVLGLPRGSGGPWLRRSAALATAGGLLTAGTAVALAGTGRLDAHGLVAIPALHHSADDRARPYTPVCRAAAIPVCLHPAYAAYLPAVTTALDPVLRELTGLPGAPVRISQGTTIYRQGRLNEVDVRVAGPAFAGTPPVYFLVLPNQLPGPSLSVAESAAVVSTKVRRDLVRAVIGDGPEPARRAVVEALLPGPSSPAAVRFAALPPAIRHAWLQGHLPDLRAGRISVAQLP
jgi:hypothetical protein